MHIRNRMLAFALLGAFSHSTRAYVYEYKKLYKENTHTTIDLLYDMHVSVPGISSKQFLRLPPEVAVMKLYPTEQKVLEALYKLNDSRSTCDLIWEAFTRTKCLMSPVDSRFITLPSFFKIWDLRYVRFIPADRHRKCGFNSLFTVFNEGEFMPSSNETGCSFNDPAPISEATTRRIMQESGYATWMRYNDLRTIKINDFKSYFGDAYFKRRALDYRKDFHKNDAFDSLCDLEILSHILASEAQSVVVYAGGLHCEKVSEFLEENGYKIRYHQRASYKELPVCALAPFECAKAIIPS